MGRKIFLLITAFAALGLMTTSCQKEEFITPLNQDTTPAPTDPRDAFIGTYDMLVVTDSLGVDDEWYSNEEMAMIDRDEAPMDGLMVITAGPDSNQILINGIVYMEGEDDHGNILRDTVPYYTTTGIINADGTVTLQSSVYDNGSFHMVFTYGPMTLADKLVFRSEMHVDIIGYDCGYIMTNTCTKR